LRPASASPKITTCNVALFHQRCRCTQTVPKAAQEEIERLRAAPPAEEMAMLIRVLCRHVPAGKQIKANAVDFLRRHGLEGSPFRVTQLKDSEK
ncbi:hypothetical protein, partial [Salipiger sp. PrR003]|uniref:hypothetical protein n=1 Tax=Salipiger sp. PrR003 TaxID=2706776 RepID=UPI00194558DC